MMYGYGPGFGFGWIFMILFWGLIIWGIFALIRGASGGGCCGSHHNGGHGHKDDNALEILKGRYAKGEITKEEFDTMKKDLEK
jgi:putative membrane protein